MNKDTIIQDFMQRFELLVNENLEVIDNKQFDILTDNFIFMVAQWTKNYGIEDLMVEYEAKHRIGFKSIEILKLQESYDLKFSKVKSLFTEALINFKL